MTNHIEALQKITGIKVSDDAASKTAANKTERGKHPGTDFLGVVTAPDVDGLSQLVKYCVKHQIHIITRSGGTALTGGSSINSARAKNSIILKLYDEIKPPEILSNGKRVRVFPGNTTLELNAMLKPFGKIVPVDLGIGDKAGKAQILGYIATDAAGSGAAFKGRASDMVHSLKVMMLDGKIYDLPSRSPTAPKLDDIIGMGGTTGIILEAVIKTTELPKKRQVAVVAIDNIAQMYALLEVFKKNCWDKMNLFERLNQELFEEVVTFTKRETSPRTQQIRQLGGNDLLFIELAGDIEDDLVTPITNSLAECHIRHPAIICGGGPEYGEFMLSYRVVNASWACENCEEKTGGEVVAFDISVPPGDIGEFPSHELIRSLRQKIPGIKIFSFGHAAGVEKISAASPKGGTAIHFNPVVPKGTTPKQTDELRQAVFREVTERGGRIVSEHTPGTKLVKYLAKYKPDEYAAYLKKIARWNPDCILNPDAYVLAQDVLERNKNSNKKTPA